MRHSKLIAVSLLLSISIIAGWCAGGPANGAAGAPAVSEIPVPPPPMGWSSWNSFSNTIDSRIVVAQANAMVNSGMQKAGYQYVNIDEGWWLGERDGNGNIVVNPAQWPALKPGERAGDMANIVNYLHSLGLKAGIYTDAGESGCSFYGPDLGPPKPHTGSEGHYEQDFLQFAKWGFDYVKVDWCGGDGENLDPAVQYAQIARAVRKAEALTGRHLFFSICNWGNSSPWSWAPGIGGVNAAIWRTSGDIVAPIVANSANSNRKASFTGMLGNFDKGIHPAAEHTGYYNDPDMMVIGMPVLTDAQNRVHMTLWAVSGAPLIVGADLTKLTAATLAALTNPEVLAVDQDSLGLQCVKISEPRSGLQVWSKRLARAGRADSRRAVVLLNRTESSAAVTVRWEDMGLEADSATVRDLWNHQDLGAHPDSYAATVPANDALLLLVTGRDRAAVRYPAVRASSGQEGAPALSCGGCSGEKGAAGKVWNFQAVKSAGPSTAIQVAYQNPHATPELAVLQVNAKAETTVTFPPTGKGRTGIITIETDLNLPPKDNSLTFSAPANGPILDSISVLP